MMDVMAFCGEGEVFLADILEIVNSLILSQSKEKECWMGLTQSGELFKTSVAARKSEQHRTLLPGRSKSS
jgi:hypothetical protein